MPRPRSEIVDLTLTPYYHVTSRCVRRAYLCGFDRETGASYNHRKQWLEERIRLLASVFSLDVCAYAVMSNHYHIVVRINPFEPEDWDDREVVDRWLCVYKGPKLIQRFAKGEQLSKFELTSVSETITKFRIKLGSLSSFMKALNEPIAKFANKEDQCTGHFWESRFSSQALCSTSALMTCMAYVDLNPFRAGIVRDPSLSPHTSFSERMSNKFNLRKAIRSQFTFHSLRNFSVDLKPLQRFSDHTEIANQDTRPTLPFKQEDYRELIHWTAERSKSKLQTGTSHNTPKLLLAHDLPEDQWLLDSGNFETLYRLGAFRPPEEIEEEQDVVFKSISH